MLLNLKQCKLYSLCKILVSLRLLKMVYKNLF